jgi:hypothetical protein
LIIKTEKRRISSHPNIASLTKIGHFSPEVKANLTNIGINLANVGFAGS